MHTRDNIPSERNPSSENNGDIDFFFVCLQEEIEDIYSISFSKAPESNELGFFKMMKQTKGRKEGKKKKNRPQDDGTENDGLFIHIGILSRAVSFRLLG